MHLIADMGVWIGVKGSRLKVLRELPTLCGLDWSEIAMHNRGTSVPTQYSPGRYEGLCVVIRGYDGGNISLSRTPR